MRQKAGKRVLFVPSLRRADGPYRLKRSFRFAAELGEEAAVYVGDERQEDVYTRDEIYKVFGFPKGKALKDIQSVVMWDLIVLDKGRTTVDDFSMFSSHTSLVVGIDEEGPARSYIPYLIDTLPCLPPNPNVASAAFLDLPPRQHEVSPEVKKLLLVFPGNAYEESAPHVAEILVKEGFSGQDMVSAAAYPAPSHPAFPSSVSFLNPANLTEQFFKYDALITSCPYTAVESVHAGVPTLCVASQTEEAERFRRLGLPEIGGSELKRDILMRFIRKPERLLDQARDLLTDRRRSLSLFLTELEDGDGSACPSCRRGGNEIVFREEHRSFFLCSGCGTVYCRRFSRQAAPSKRQRDAKEGGVSLEHMESFRNLSVRRLLTIKFLLGAGRGELLDVGCSYGAFGSVASDEGFTPYCLDRDSGAVSYVRDILGLASFASRFEDLDPRKSGLPDAFDVITIWGIFDHFADLDSVLRKLNTLLRKGGVLALASANLGGAGGKKNLGEFLSSLPFHHRFAVSPQVLQSVLKRYGFSVKTVRTRGSVRIGEPGKRLAPSLWERMASIVRPGDFFELYAVKDRSLT